MKDIKPSLIDSNFLYNSRGEAAGSFLTNPINIVIIVIFILGGLYMYSRYIDQIKKVEKQNALLKKQILEEQRQAVANVKKGPELLASNSSDNNLNYASII